MRVFNAKGLEVVVNTVEHGDWTRAEHIAVSELNNGRGPCYIEDDDGNTWHVTVATIDKKKVDKDQLPLHLVPHFK